MAGAHHNIVPFGCHTATIQGFVDNQIRENYPIGRCFPDPPSLPGDGYCVSYDFDYGQGTWLCNQSPIVIATGRAQKYKFTRPENGVFFDLNADGQTELVSWTELESEVAFLAFDRNANGKIDDGSELFGNNTIPGKGNGFAALRAMAGEVGAVDASNGLALLVLWHDRNQDGVSQASELTPATAYLEAIGLGYTADERKDGNGNAFRYRGWARRLAAAEVTAQDDNIVWGTRAEAGDDSREGREFKIYDVFLKAAQ